MHLLLPTLVVSTRLLERVTLQEQFLSHITPDSRARQSAGQVLGKYKGDYDMYQPPIEPEVLGEDGAGRYRHDVINNGVGGDGTPQAARDVCARQSLILRKGGDGAVIKEASNFDLSPACSANEISTNVLIKDYAQICLSEKSHQLCLKIDPSDSSIAVVYDGETLNRRRIISISENFTINVQLLFTKASGQFEVILNGRQIFDVSIKPEMTRPVASLSANGGAELFSQVQYI